MEEKELNISDVIGFQIYTKECGKPLMTNKNEVFSLPQCGSIILGNGVTLNDYEIRHVFKNQIENPVMRFGGNPFTAGIK